MKMVVCVLLLFLAVPVFAANSALPEKLTATGTGEACLSEYKTKSATERVALVLAKRNAAESAVTLIQSYTEIENMELIKDRVTAQVNSNVRTSNVISRQWTDDPSFGKCFSIEIEIEVYPNME